MYIDYKKWNVNSLVEINKCVRNFAQKAMIVYYTLFILYLSFIFV